MALLRSGDLVEPRYKAELVETAEKPGGVELVNANRTFKTASPHDLVDLAHVVQRGDEGVKSNACNKLSVIADQIRYLQEQARKVLEQAKRDSELHHAASNMVKKPGTTYFLYQRPTGQKYFSLLSPQEWGSSMPHKYLGGYRLEIDRSWTPIDEIRSKDEENMLLDSVLQSKQGFVKAAIALDSHNPPN